MDLLEILTYLVWLVASVTFILALKFLASPRTASTGNLLGAAGMALVVAWTFFVRDGEFGIPDTWWIIVLGAAIGAVAGWLGAKRVAMTAMPQMVAIFNGAGGGAAALVAVVEFLRDTSLHPGELLPLAFVIATLLGAIIGSVSLTGSVVAFGKLQGIIAARPVKYPGSQIVTAALFLALVGIGVYLAVVEPSVPLFLLFVGAVADPRRPARDADRWGGHAGRRVAAELVHRYRGRGHRLRAEQLRAADRRHAGRRLGRDPHPADDQGDEPFAVQRPLCGFGTGGGAVAAGEEGEEQLREINAEDAAVLMAYGKRVIIVPGYGMAVAQAQGPVRELMDLLLAKGVDVQFAIHPVAGRMPGHMNVLLAEANVPYDRLKEMDEINDDFADTDVALIIGANDVVNPVAREEGSPISGMPILNVDQAQNVIVLKRGRGAGFAGIPNPLFSNEKTKMLFGDAKPSVEDLVAGVKQA